MASFFNQDQYLCILLKISLCVSVSPDHESNMTFSRLLQLCKYKSLKYLWNNMTFWSQLHLGYKSMYIGMDNTTYGRARILGPTRLTIVYINWWQSIIWHLGYVFSTFSSQSKTNKMRFKGVANGLRSIMYCFHSSHHNIVLS